MDEVFSGTTIRDMWTKPRWVGIKGGGGDGWFGGQRWGKRQKTS